MKTPTNCRICGIECDPKHSIKIVATEPSDHDAFTIRREVVVCSETHFYELVERMKNGYYLQPIDLV
jgi:hypothetical protein